MKHTGQIWKEGATQPLVVQLTIYFLTNSLITDPNHLHDYTQWFEQRYLSSKTLIHGPECVLEAQN